MRHTQKRKKRNVPEFTPPERKCIELAHDQKESSFETDINSITNISKESFKNLLPYYLYEISFPPNSNLHKISCLYAPYIYSISLPASLTKIKANSFKECHFLQQITFLKDENGKNNLKYIGNHAFESTIIQSITIPENVKFIGSFCFPPTLKQIDFENGAPNLTTIGDKAFSNTQMESFKMPLKPLFYYKMSIFFKCKKLKTIIFDSYVNKDDQTSIEAIQCTCNQFCHVNIEKLEVFNTVVSGFDFYGTPNLIEISVPQIEKSQYFKQDGCLYSKDKTDLIVAERNVKSVKICSECIWINNWAFENSSLEQISFDDDSKLEIIEKYSFQETQIKSIKIPDSVRQIIFGSFAYCRKLESVYIPRSTRFLSSCLFPFTNLKEILIPNNIECIDAFCFFNCKQLQIVKFEDNSKLEMICDFSFMNTKIKSIEIPNSVTYLKSYCFTNCTELKTIELDDSQSNLTKIESGCFNNTQIESLKLPQKIIKYDFSFSNVLTVSFSEFSSLTFISNFKSSKIKQISIPPSVKTICRHGFFDCTNLTEVTIIDFKNSQLETISDYAFYNCVNLTVFELPEKVKFFGKYSFKNCIKYNYQINLNNIDDKIIICENAFEESGIVSFISQSQSIQVDDFAFKECKNLTSFQVKTNEECILGSSTFIDCSNLKTVLLSQSSKVVELGKNCFMNSSIIKFDVPQNLKKIPKTCFKNCHELLVLSIHDNSEIVKFGTNAFLNSGLESVFIPSKTKKIKQNCFAECKSLKSLNFSKDLQDCIIYEKAFYMSGIEQLNVPNGIKEIGISCFKKCEKLKHVDFSENKIITEIKYKTFKSSGIETLTTSTSIEFVRQSAFQNCQQLKKVNLISDQVLIFPFAFADCINLQEIKYGYSLSIQLIICNQYPEFKTYIINFTDKRINKNLIEPLFVSKEPLFQTIQKSSIDEFYVISDKVRYIEPTFDKDDFIIEKYGEGYYTFGKKELLTCDFLSESLNVAKEAEMIKLCACNYSQLKTINFEANSNLKIIDNFAFENLQIEEINLPDSLITIGNWAFNHCHSLKKVNINSKCKLETIGKYAFCGTAIESIVFPSTLKTIDSFAFFECFMLNTVDNQSNEIRFKEGCFSCSSIESFIFPQFSIFGKSSFKKCYKLKQLKFLKEPTKLIFKEDCFAFSGLQEIKIKCDVDIGMRAFSFCSSLKKVSVSCININIMSNSFASSNIDILVFETKITTSIDQSNESIPILFDNFRSILMSNIEKISLKLLIYNKYTKNNIKYDFFLNHKCYTVNDILIYADMINNQLLFEKLDENDKDDVKKNEILRVPSNVTKVDFPIMTHIKKINWGTNGVVKDLGPPRNFSYYNLTQIIIPKLVNVIPSNAFEHCHYLSSITFEKGSELKEIGDFSFANTRISKIVFPKSVQKIGKSAFSDNKYLNEVVFHGEYIDDEAFYNTGIKSFKLSNNTRFIGSKTFQYCHDLTNFDIDIENSNLSEIGQYAFSESSIIEINIPKEVKVIKKSTFSGCQNLKKVIISNKSKLTSIKSRSFACNLALEKINLPKTITKISYQAFINTPSLQSIMEESNQFYNVMKDNSIYRNDNTLLFVPRNLQQFEISKECSIIHSGSFCGSNLNNVILSSPTLIKIEQLGFAHCTNLKNITIPNSVEYIGKECFIDCQNLEKIEFQSQSKIKEIPKYCFAFSGLKFINLPESIEIINHSSFLYCHNLKSINLYNTNINYIGDYAFSGTNLEEVKFPSSIQYIGNYSFGGNHSLLKIDFSEVDEVEDFNCQTKKQLKSLLLNKQPKKAIFKINNHDESIKQIVPVNDTNNIETNEKITSLNNSETKNDQIEMVNISSSQSKPIIQKPTIFIPTSKSQIGNPVIISSSSSIKSIDNVKLLPQSSNQSLHISLKPNELHDIGQVNDTDNTIKTLQDTIRKLEETNLQKDEIIKKQSETIKKQEEIIKQQAELIQKLKGLANEQGNKKPDDKELFNSGNNKEKDPNVDNNIQSTVSNDITNSSLACFVHNNAFCNSLAKIFKFNLKKYKWFSFFSQCNSMEEYIANDDIHLYLQKSSTENMDDVFSGHLYKIIKLKYSNQENIPILRNQHITEFSISKMTKMLNPYHFSFCYKLTTIEFEDGIKIKKIPRNCFSYTSLKKIKIPMSVRIIEKSAFFSCEELEEVTFSNDCKLRVIKENAFCKCDKLNEIKIPSNLKTITKNCFSFTGLKCIELPKSIQKIDSMAFFNCKKLSKIVLNDGLLEISDLSFAYNISLESIDLPNTLTKIKTKAFSNCSNLKKVNTTEKTQLVEIHDGSFECTQIEEIGVNRNATKLFEPINLPNLNKITFYNGKPINFIQFEDGTVYTKNEKFNNENKELDISEIEKQINNGLYKETILSNIYFLQLYYRLREIFYPSVYTNVFDRDFNNSGDAFDIILKRNRSKYSNDELQKKNPILHLLFAPRNLKTLKIHEDCFSMSSSIIERIQNISTIEYSKGSTNFVFNFPNLNHHYSKTLNTIKILGDYSYIEEGVFSHFESLEIVEFNPETNISFIQKNAFLDCKKLQKIIIPSSCISIEEGAFKDCINLSSLQFGTEKLKPKIKYIRKEAFYNCSSLEFIEIPDTVLAICEGAFMNCSKLQKINIKSDQSSLEIIGKNAFKNCHSLKSFYLPSKCYVLGPSSFMNCKNLEEFKFYSKVLLSIHSRIFYNCCSLKRIELTDLNFENVLRFCKIKNEYFKYYEYDKNLIDITKEKKEVYKYEYEKDDKENDANSLFSIGPEAFMNCTSLTEVIIKDQSTEVDTIKLDKEELLINYPLHFNPYILINQYAHIIIRYRPTIVCSIRQTIQRGAFCNCKSLSRVCLFLGNLEHIHENVFMNCNSLKTIEINSQYSRYLLYEGTYPNAYKNTSKDFVINLFNKDKCIKTINIINKPHRSIKVFKEYLSLNKSLIMHQNIEKEVKNVRPKSTFIKLFDSPHIKIRNQFGNSQYGFFYYNYHGMICLSRHSDITDKENKKWIEECYQSLKERERK